MRKLSTLVLAVLLAGGVLAACGGDDSKSSTSAGATVTAAADVGSVAGFASKDCIAAATAMAKAAGGAGAAFSGQSADFEASVKELEKISDAVPNEIKADFKVVVKAYGEFVTALVDSGYDPSSGKMPSADQMAALSSLSAKFDNADFKAATAHVDTYFKTKCK